MRYFLMAALACVTCTLALAQQPATVPSTTAKSVVVAEPDTMPDSTMRKPVLAPAERIDERERLQREQLRNRHPDSVRMRVDTTNSTRQGMRRIMRKLPD